MTRILIGFLGLSFILLGFVLTKADKVTITNKFLFTLGIIILAGFACFLTKHLEKYFLQTASVVKRIDKIYGLHDTGFYVDGVSILNDDWKGFGSESWREPIFLTAYIGFTLMGLFSVVLVWSLDGYLC